MKFEEEMSKIGRVFYFIMHVKPKMETALKLMYALNEKEAIELIKEIDKDIRDYSKGEE